MAVLWIFLLVSLGWLLGYISNSLLTMNTYEENCANAFERGRAFERERISKMLEDQKDNDA